MNIITTLDQLDEMVEHYLKQDAFAYDLETVGPNRGITVLNDVLWISFSTHGRGDVIPMGHPNGDDVEIVYPLTGQGEKRVAAGLPARPSDYSRDIKKATHTFSAPPEQLFPAEVFKRLRPLLFGENRVVVGHNLVFDLTSIAKYYNGEVPTGPYFDTMVGSFIYDNKNKNKCGLDDCLAREFGYHMVKGVGKEVEKYGFTTVATYAYLDAKYTFLLYKHLLPLIKERKLETVMSLEMSTLRVLCDMKLTGAPIDVANLEVLHDKLQIDIEAARAEIYSVGKRVFNINSNPEKQQMLYGLKAEGGQGIKPKILTLGGQKKKDAGTTLSLSDYSVSAEALEAYRGNNPLVDAMLNYADLNKLLSTYVIPYFGGDVTRTTNGKSRIEYKDSLLVEGRIHGDFIQHGAETGRFSSRSPNLQNLPAPNKKLPPEKDYGTIIRNLFHAPEGFKLVVADYSQIEPRVIASMSKDPIMMQNYLDGGDIYTTIGDTMGIDRKAGKTLVLAIAYGVGPDKIAKDVGCSVTEAKQLLNDFSAKFWAVDTYKARVVAGTRAAGYVSTISGRKRYLPEINSNNYRDRSSAERQAFNTRIQGSAADIIKMAMVRAYEMIPKEAHIILTVHDELVVLTPDRLASETESTLREAMEGIDVLSVPLIADIHVVTGWGAAK